MRCSFCVSVCVSICLPLSPVQESPDSAAVAGSRQRLEGSALLRHEHCAARAEEVAAELAKMQLAGA